MAIMTGAGMNGYVIDQSEGAGSGRSNGCSQGQDRVKWMLWRRYRFYGGDVRRCRSIFAESDRRGIEGEDLFGPLAWELGVV